MSTIDEPAALARLRAIVPPTVRQACATLAARGHVAVCVGGAVRDALLGRDPGDWDVASSALPEEIIAIFPRTIPTGLQHGTVTVLLGHGEARLPVEITTFRGEGEYLDARRPSSVNRASGSPTARRRLACTSATPPNGSTSCSAIGS